MVIADALSRAPSREPIESDLLLQQETRAFIDIIVNSLPASEKRVEEIKLAQEQDEACSYKAGLIKGCQSSCEAILCSSS